MGSEEDEPALGSAALEVRKRVARRERVVASAAHPLGASRAVRVDVPEVLLALEHEHGGGREVAVDRAMAAVPGPAHDHVERPAGDVVAQDRVVVADLVGAARIARDLAPPVAARIEVTALHLEILLRNGIPAYTVARPKDAGSALKRRDGSDPLPGERAAERRIGGVVDAAVAQARGLAPGVAVRREHPEAALADRRERP